MSLNTTREKLKDKARFRQYLPAYGLLISFAFVLWTGWSVCSALIDRTDPPWFFFIVAVVAAVAWLVGLLIFSPKPSR